MPIKRTHSLSRHGYSSKKGPAARRRSLRRALAEQTRAKGGQRAAFTYIIRKLSALRTLTKRTNPRASRAFEANMRWLQRVRDAGGA